MTCKLNAINLEKSIAMFFIVLTIFVIINLHDAIIKQVIKTILLIKNLNILLSRINIIMSFLGEHDD